MGRYKCNHSRWGFSRQSELIKQQINYPANRLCWELNNWRQEGKIGWLAGSILSKEMAWVRTQQEYFMRMAREVVLRKGKVCIACGKCGVTSRNIKRSRDLVGYGMLRKHVLQLILDQVYHLKSHPLSQTPTLRTLAEDMTYRCIPREMQLILYCYIPARPSLGFRFQGKLMLFIYQWLVKIDPNFFLSLSP